MPVVPIHQHRPEIRQAQPTKLMPAPARATPACHVVAATIFLYALAAFRAGLGVLLEPLLVLLVALLLPLLVAKLLLLLIAQLLLLLIVLSTREPVMERDAVHKAVAAAAGGAGHDGVAVATLMQLPSPAAGVGAPSADRQGRVCGLRCTILHDVITYVLGGGRSYECQQVMAGWSELDGSGKRVKPSGIVLQTSHVDQSGLYALFASRQWCIVSFCHLDPSGHAR